MLGISIEERLNWGHSFYHVIHFLKSPLIKGIMYGLPPATGLLSGSEYSKVDGRANISAIELMRATVHAQ